LLGLVEDWMGVAEAGSCRSGSTVVVVVGPTSHVELLMMLVAEAEPPLLNVVVDSNVDCVSTVAITLLLIRAVKLGFDVVMVGLSPKSVVIISVPGATGYSTTSVFGIFTR
jgi:hypothetical protein